MLNPRWFHNSKPDGLPVLQIEGMEPERARFVPLKRTELHGEIDGPFAELELVQTFSFSSSQQNKVVEALYRFPLPGDAAVLSVKVRFGDVEIQTELKPRIEAEKEYEKAKKRGDQAALASRESPDVFTLQIVGIAPDEPISITTKYIQLGDRASNGFIFRVPLTTAPRYVRQDERFSSHARGQPLALLRDPGHRFSLDIVSRSGGIASPTHKLRSTDGHIVLEEGEVIPDRDCVLVWEPEAVGGPVATMFIDEDETGRHFLALVSPPIKKPMDKRAKELIVLVDHSGSMHGAKWAAADWAVEKLLEGLKPKDFFNLCLFHSRTSWFGTSPVLASKKNIAAAIAFLKDKTSGGTELGVALEQAMNQPLASGTLDRQVLLLTDAQVSDEARILQVVEGGATSKDIRRTSIICIDSAPNSYLAKMVARKGRGICRFLSSSPDEVDITSALDGVLAEMCSPQLGASSLVFDSRLINVLDASFVSTPNGGRIDLTDLRYGSSAFFVGRLAKGARAPKVRLEGEGFNVEVPCVVSPTVRSLYGSGLVAELERLMLGSRSEEQVLRGLKALGLNGLRGKGDRSVYHENDRNIMQKVLEEVLVETSLAYGVASSATSFLAIRREAGRKVEGSAVVAGALPHGWSEDFLSAAPIAMGKMIAAPMQYEALLDSDTSSRKDTISKRRLCSTPPARGEETKGMEVQLFSGIPQFKGNEALLFNSRAKVKRTKLPNDALFTLLMVTSDVPLVKEGIELLFFVGDLSMPALRLDLAELVRKGGRPINLRVRKSDVVMVVLIDGAGGASFDGHITVSLKA